MAKKAKEGTLDLYYLNSNNKKEIKNTRTKKISPSKSRNKKNDINNSNNDAFNFDNEIVIGINVVPDKKKTASTNNKNKTAKQRDRKTDKNKKKTQTSTRSKDKAIQNNESKFDFDNEIVIGVNVVPDEKNDKKSKKSKKGKTTKKSSSDKNNKKNINRKNDKRLKKQNMQKSNDNIINEDKHKKNYKRAKFILKIFLIISLFTIVAIFLLTSPLFNITKINVSGNAKISEEEILSLSKIKLETNTYKIVKSNIEQNIKENAYVDTAYVKRKLPNEVDIIITERKPQYMIQYGNAYVYINNQGYMLEISEEKLDMPIITGYKTAEEEIKVGNRLNQEDLKRLEMILKIMESVTNNDMYADITKIDISDANNYTLILELKNKTAYIGDASSINDKMIVLKQILIKEEGKKGEAFLKDKDKMYFREEK